MSKAAWMFQLHGDARGIARKLGEGIHTNIFPGQQVMLSVVRVDPNSSGTIHSHPEEQWGVLLEGKCTRVQDGEAIEAVAGDFWYTPGGVPHTVHTGDASAVILDIFSPPREEYKRAGTGFGSGTAKAS